MTLIKSISGIRGTIGGKSGENLTPPDIIKFTLAFGTWLKNRNSKLNTVIIGRDARISGQMVQNLVVGALQSIGLNVLDVGLSTTPTVEMMVQHNDLAAGGIILTASHNPKQWNALKLLKENGEFINGEQGKKVLEMAESGDFEFVEVDDLGKHTFLNDAIEQHIEHILQLDLVDVEAITASNFTVAIDCVNSTGGLALPPLLKSLGVKNVIELYTDPTGDFPHNPEPLPQHLTTLSETIKTKGADVGFVVDPDVDRLAIVCENGEMFGEEYTLVAVADYILQHKKGTTVSNLSSTRALRDVTESYGEKYFASAVGEVNVVAKMKAENAVIGGEGNGGIIYPELHYGRDALVGIALFLSHLAHKKITCSELKSTYPFYHISKNKIQLTPQIDVDDLLKKLEAHFSNYDIDTTDGVKVDMPDGWIHLRKSNTEPIIRIYTEANNEAEAEKLADMVKSVVAEILG